MTFLVKLLIAALIIAATIGIGLWSLGEQQPSRSLDKYNTAIFVALKTRDRFPKGAPMVMAALFKSRAAYTFVGPDELYWTDFLILPPGSEQLLREAGSFEDIYAAEVQLTKVPSLLLGFLRAQHLLGITQRSTAPLPTSPEEFGTRLDILPSKAALTASSTGAHDMPIAMMNFIEYLGTESGDKTTSRESYGRYGLEAMKSVHAVGGQFLFAGQIKRIILASNRQDGSDAWDDLAAMIYPDPLAILSMEQNPDYKQALSHRDVALKRTVVVATEAYSTTRN